MQEENLYVKMKNHEPMLYAFGDEYVAKDFWNGKIGFKSEYEAVKFWKENCKIKNCPFCNSEADVYNTYTSNDNRGTNYFILCKNPYCGCKTKEIEAYFEDGVEGVLETRRKLIEIWNRRSSLDNIGGAK